MSDRITLFYGFALCLLRDCWTVYALFVFVWVLMLLCFDLLFDCFGVIGCVVCFFV